MTRPEDQAELLGKLHSDTRVPPAEKVTQVDKGFGPIDVLGHADTTDLILQHDPLWDWEPPTEEELERLGFASALVRDADGWPRGLWIALTIHGKRRLGFGTCAPKKPDAVKELIGDAIRNASMRFGVALSLWSKADAKGWADLDEATESEEAEARAPEPQPSGKAPATRKRPRGETPPTPPGDDTAELSEALTESLRDKLAQRLAGLSEDAEVKAQRRRELRKWYGKKYDRPLDEDIRLGDLSREEVMAVFAELERREW